LNITSTGGGKEFKVEGTYTLDGDKLAMNLKFGGSEVNEIVTITKLTDETIEPAVNILCKARVLNASPEDGKAVVGTSYSLNYNFKNKKVKINLNITPKTEQKVESEDTHKTIEEDRKLLLQAVIVRIMKGRKKLKHVLLVEEVINQVRNRFPPKISDIKKNIDALMEKDYIERLDNDELAYIA